MKHVLLFHGPYVALVLLICAFLASCAHKHDYLKLRVPDHKIEEAKSWKAPFKDTRTASAQIVSEGKGLFQGRGNCFMCHGMEGKGDGPA